MKRIIKKLLYIFFIIDIILIGLVLYKIKTDITLLVEIKYLLFVNSTSDKDLFNSPPQRFKDVGFQIDSPDSIKQWSARIMSKVHYTQNINTSITKLSEIEKAKFLVLLFSRNGGVGCSDDIGLLNKLQKLPEGNGYGCCTDHTEAFIALGSIFGLTVREVHTAGHVTNEFFSEKLNKWIWIDPSYSILAKNKNGEYLSLTEIRDSYYKDEWMTYDFFGNEYHYFHKNNPFNYLYYDSKEDFSDIMVTWGNNVFKEGEFNQSLFFLHKSVRQFIGITTGVMPSYLKYVDGNNVQTKMQHKKMYGYLGLFLILIIGNTFYPFYIIVKIFLVKHKNGKTLMLK